MTRDESDLAGAPTSGWLRALLVSGVVAFGACADTEETADDATTSPSTSAVPTTRVPDIAPTTTRPIGSVETEAPPTPRVMSSPTALGAWPSPADAVRTPAPPYLPFDAIPDTQDRVRFTLDVGDGSSSAYVQQWVDPAGAYFAIESLVPFVPSTPAESRTLVDTAGWTTVWDEAFIARTGPGFVNLQLFDAESVGVVRLRALNLDEQDVIRAASTMRRVGADAPGWVLPDLPPGLVASSEGEARNAQVREVLYSDGVGSPRAQVRISTVPDDVQLNWFTESTVSTAEIGEHTAIITSGDSDSTVTIRWIPEPGVVLIAARTGTIDDALLFARSVRPVEESAWQAAASEPSGDYLTKCSGLFC